MSWKMNHAESTRLAVLAHEYTRQGDIELALQHYRKAAEYEMLAIEHIAPEKSRTLGITVVSAASLWYKARAFDKARNVAYRFLATNNLPVFAVAQLEELLQVVWDQESQLLSGIEFTSGEVLVSVSGGEIVRGGAPLELIVRKVDEISKIFYRIVESILHLPFRRRGAPDIKIQEQFRPWLFQAPPGSYQFAVRVEKPKQLSLFPDTLPDVEIITTKFMQVLKASIDDPLGELEVIVPDQEYRETFLKLARNLAPTGKVFGQMQIAASPILAQDDIILIPSVRDSINQTLRSSAYTPPEAPTQEEKQITGVLRGLQLDQDWLEINADEDPSKPVRIFDALDIVDDIVGPMVNHRVVVTVIEKGQKGQKGKLVFRDIQREE